MKALVTGGAGFIGSHLTDRLISQKCDVFVIDNLSSGRMENINNKAKIIRSDISDSKVQEEILRIAPDVIFHLAAQIDVRKSVENPQDDARVNIIGSLNILEGARKAGCKNIIFASSGGAIYGDAQSVPTTEEYTAMPISPYGIAKQTIEHYLYYYYKVFDIRYVALRFANVYGPRQNHLGEAGVVAIFCNKMIHRDAPRIFGDGRQTRDYTYVSDIVEANILAMQSNKVGSYNVGTGIETDVNSLCHIIKDRLSFKGEIIHAEEKMGEVKRSCLDATKIKNDLGWDPRVTLDTGIEKTIQYFIDKK